MQEYIGKVSLNYTYYSGIDEYSDGQVEDQLIEIVKNSEEDNYNEIITERKSWPILYHLSHIRNNIIEWLPITKNNTVLEIGSGCGALTGKLAEMSKQVTCIELSKVRSLINAYRNKSKSNIEIIVGNFENIEKDIYVTYDYIILVGVFEYAANYINSKAPYEDMLKKIAKHLNKNGKIIIAIENKLGLKYWAGCKEDHLGEYYKGIEGYIDSKKVMTFSKKELETMFIKQGLHKMKFYYPYPDYKLPSTIYSDERLPLKNELIDNFRNFDQDRLVTFDESLVFNTIIENGLFETFSNSFLVVIEKD